MTDQYVVPPPPPDSPLEVTIRTRAGDLELLQKSGGSAAGLSGSSVTIRSSAAPTTTETDERKSQTFIWALVAIVGAVVLFFVGYFLVPLITEKPAVNNSGQNAGAATSTKKTPVAAEEPTYFGHTSFFKETPDATREFNPYLTATGPIDRAFIVTMIDTLTKDASSTGTLIELATKNSEGRPLIWGEVASIMGAPELDQAVMGTLFMRDITVFVWRDKTGIWPGFIFKLKDGVAPLLAQRQALGIENPTDRFKNLFLIPPQTAASAFADTQVSGQPARSLSFQKPNATFTYGWFFRNYFVMSTSYEGLRQAITRL
ncbi:MAG: hypothetical protein A2946_03260 [Candidatus Liptonbacteria bacterium RIFCSPLOWO2_01_FULL_53_13]|uniref:Uncharacterized protein n=1 Tax=Candidatus Liptonbacteria bacterium RIFCSPLOWO2_01_FULL_53_13 TaxID=1798651 RepID=A0A1G2CIX4_9BACT|nr:MAG: hypothetical protein A2946_03260 [Candidatus Liptonbacteria bacterium RIFCSPLOWO2_01_FULL_53_13]